MNEKAKIIFALEKSLQDEIKKNLIFSVFNPRIKELKDLIKKEQETCEHEFDENGVCIHCHKLNKKGDK